MIKWIVMTYHQWPELQPMTCFILTTRPWLLSIITVNYLFYKTSELTILYADFCPRTIRRCSRGRFFPLELEVGCVWPQDWFS